ncbi:hypothetical protein [Streptobacillus moniliformis]|uniref:hypothetical protein n=1 Tax=Streptobacillus moniliformis TaxID=34105 RepID=UPI0007E47E45|nr:hypothetical protein [Streptobacillus moniliformis]
MRKVTIINRNGNKLIKFKDNKIHSLGKILKYKDEQFIVNESQIELKNNIFFCTVECSKIGEYKLKRIKNIHITGSSLRGRVIKIFSKDEKAYMNVDFSEFLKEKYGNIQSFGKNYIDIPYKTFYSQSNTGLFPTPEINDVVDVIFIDDNENNMKVSWSLENENSSRFNDGEKRNYLNKEIDFNINKNRVYINFKNKMEILATNFVLNSKDVLISAKEKLGIASQLDISIEANDDLQIFGNEVALKSKSKNLNIVSEGNLLLKGKQIHND